MSKVFIPSSGSRPAQSVSLPPGGGPMHVPGNTQSVPVPSEGGRVYIPGNGSGPGRWINVPESKM